MLNGNALLIKTANVVDEHGDQPFGWNVFTVDEHGKDTSVHIRLVDDHRPAASVGRSVRQRKS